MDIRMRDSSGEDSADVHMPVLGGEDQNDDDDVDITFHERPRKRAPKRAKTSAVKTVSKNKGPSRKAVSGRIQGRLNLLPKMPIDIVDEVLFHLHPGDLIRLSFVNKSFYLYLMGKRREYVWREAYDNVPEIPRWPADMSIPAWTHLLFGGTYCYNCRNPPVLKVLFMVRRRLCDKCFKDLRTRNVGPYTGILTPMLREAVFSFDEKGGLATDSPDWKIFHLKSDLNKFFAEANALATEFRDPALFKEQMAEWLVLRRAAVDARKKHAKICEQWVSYVASERQREIREIREKRFEQVKARFLQVGYDECDIDELRDHSFVKRAKPLTEKALARAFPDLEASIITIRDERLVEEGEAEARRSQRKQLLDTAYIELLTELPAKTVPFVLGFELLYAQSVYKEALEEDQPDLDPEDLKQELKDAISPVVQTFLDALQVDMAAVASLVPLSNKAKLWLVNNRRRPVGDEMTADEDLSTVYFCVPELELAMTHFNSLPLPGVDCQHPPNASGLRTIAHRCGPQGKHVRFCELSQQIVLELLQLAGMGPLSTAHQMDLRDARFVCMLCPPEVYGVPGNVSFWRTGMCWRSSLEHGRTAHPQGHRIWKILGDPDRWIVKHGEKSRMQSYVSQPRWGCGHCNFHLRLSQSLTTWLDLYTVLTHLAEEHGINSPHQEVDYISNLREYDEPCYADGKIRMNLEDEPWMPSVISRLDALEGSSNASVSDLFAT